MANDLPNGAGPSAPGSDDDAPAVIESAIHAAMASAMAATREFDGVYYGAFALIDGRSAEDRRAVAIEPMDSTVVSAWDAGLPGEYVDHRVRVVVLARDRDGLDCDQVAAELLAVVQGLLIKANLGGLVMPEFSRVSRWVWQRATAPERRIETTFQCRYLID